MVKDEGNDPVLEGVGKYFLSFKNYSLIEDPVQTDEYLIVTYIPIRELLINRPAQKQFIPIHPNCSLVDVDKTVEQNIIKGIKQEFGEKGTFHLKSQGIKIIARTVEISDRDNRISIQITDTDNEGIIDGANLYNIIKDMKVEDVSKHSYIKLEIHVIKNLTTIDNIVESLDSKLVKRKSSDISKKELFWLEEIVEETDYKDKIDLLEVLALINLFRSNYYDSEVNNQPTDSYWNKQSVIQQYKENPKSFIQYRTIVKDILYLYDYINIKTQENWPTKKGSLSSLGLTTNYKQKGYEFQILGKKLDYKLHDAVIYALLNGFRSFVIFNPDGTARWSKEFSKLLNLYDEIGNEIVGIIKDYSANLGHNPHLVGKNKMLYSIVYKEFMMGDMLNQFL
jgi:hypothetical protein